MDFKNKTTTLPLRKSFVEMCLVQLAKKYNYASISSQERLITFKDEQAEPISNYTCCSITYTTNTEKARDCINPWTPHMVHISKVLLCIQQNILLLSHRNSVV